MCNMMVKDCHGRSGGLVLVWKRSIDVHVRMMLKLYINANMIEGHGFVWRFTVFYGERSLERKTVLEGAVDTKSSKKTPVVMYGGF